MEDGSALTPSALRRVRWLGVIGLAGLIVAGWVGPMPTPPLSIGLLLIAVAVGLNLLMEGAGLERMSMVLGPVLIADTLVITALLWSAGGASNPFTLLYLFPVVLAALALPPAWTVALLFATTSAFGALFAFGPDPVHHMDMTQHLLGMVVAYAGTVPLLAISVYRFRSATHEALVEARSAREATQRAERLASLAGLAGGAAHELSTPLSTIFMVARELERNTSDPDTLEDLALIRSEVQRCQEVLDLLAAEVGAGMGEACKEARLSELVGLATHGGGGVQIDVQDAMVNLPEKLVVHALRRLLGNARDASDGGVVRLRAFLRGTEAHFEVEDEGVGMSPEVLERAKEPFFTTKPTGEGRGLGLFFVHTVAQQLSGRFDLRSTVGEGTCATLVLPSGLS